MLGKNLFKIVPKVVPKLYTSLRNYTTRTVTNMEQLNSVMRELKYDKSKIPEKLSVELYGKRATFTTNGINIRLFPDPIDKDKTVMKLSSLIYSGDYWSADLNRQIVLDSRPTLEQLHRFAMILEASENVDIDPNSKVRVD